MYSFSPKLRSISLIMLVLGAVLFVGGYFINHGIGKEQVAQMMEEVNAHGHHAPSNSSEMKIAHDDHEGHLEAAMHQVHNRPIAAIHFVSVFFFGLACAVMFFYSIQHAAHAGWSIIITRVMEAIGAYIPWGGAIVIIIMILNVTHVGHLFHWMDPEVVDMNSPKFDAILFEKSKYLNIPSYVIRNIIYVAGASFFAWKLRSQSRKVDETKSLREYQYLYRWSVGYIAFFGLHLQLGLGIG